MLAPFTLIALIPVALMLIRGVEQFDLFVMSLVLTLAVAASTVFVPWERLPYWPQMVPGGMYCASIALAREAEGGAASGLSFLLLLPVLWQALYGERRGLYCSVVFTTLTLVIPVVLFGAPLYPAATEWSRIVVWLAVAPIAGAVVHGLVDKLRTSEEGLARMAHVAHGLTLAGDNRESICRAAMEVGEADVAYLIEPADADRLVSTAVAGVVVPPLEIAQKAETSAAAECFLSCAPIFVHDAPATPQCDAVVQATGVASIHYQPVVRSREVIGVLVVGWLRRQPRLTERLSTSMTLLAAEAGVAMERADRLSDESKLARRDPLTGLPNRRTWDEDASRAVAVRQRSDEPLTLALVDIDHFKEFNDTQGHQAGDLFLKEAAAAWRATLREGDLLARWGGEEFAVLLPQCTGPRALEVLDRLRNATPRDQSCSVGITEVTAEDTLDFAVERADRALYAAKTGGRNLAVLDESIQAEHLPN